MLSSDLPLVVKNILMMISDQIRLMTSNDKSDFLKAPQIRSNIQSKQNSSVKLRKFDTFVQLNDSGNHSATVSLGSIYGNSCLDILLSTGRHWQSPVLLYQNDGYGAFLTSPVVVGNEKGYKSYGIPVGDLNHNGHLDFVVGTDLGAQNPIFFGSGDGSFKLAGNINDTGATRNIAIADLTGNGYLDIIVCNRRQQGYVFINDSKGNFTQKVPFGGPDDSNVSVVTGDMNNNGILDLIVARRDFQQSVVLLNDGNANFRTSIAFGPSNADTRAIAVGKVTGSDYLDIIACHLNLGTFIYSSDGGSGYYALVKLSDSRDNFFCLAVADLCCTGMFDIIAGSSGANNIIFFNNANNTFSDDQGNRWLRREFGDSVVNGVEEGMGKAQFSVDSSKVVTYGVAIGDMNGNGYLDIVVARSGAPSGIFFSSPILQDYTVSTAKSES